MTQANHPVDRVRTTASEVDLRAAGIPSPLPSPPASLVPRKQGAWGLWWLCMVTFSIYYFIWYDRINGELSAILGQPRRANSRWWNQIIPFWAFVGLAATAKRLNAAHASVGSPTRVGVFTAWFWAPGWFGSQTRYLQRRVNILHDVLTSRATHQGY
ncbi:hypothetical protein [Parafrankia sp. FMc2]|uniref:hypothetical protein n=1 Tax=Parafrankia sp. FMc2 TaxID=3233196 RepID=UPI0034D73862